MIKRNILNFILPLYWGLQGVFLLSIQSIGAIIAAVILLTISLLKVILRNPNCDILFLVVCFFYSVCLCVTIFLLYSLFEISILLPIFTVVNFLVIVCMYVKVVWALISSFYFGDMTSLDME